MLSPQKKNARKIGMIIDRTDTINQVRPIKPIIIAAIQICGTVVGAFIAAN